MFLIIFIIMVIVVVYFFVCMFIGVALGAADAAKRTQYILEQDRIRRQRQGQQ